MITFDLKEKLGYFIYFIKSLLFLFKLWLCAFIYFFQFQAFKILRLNLKELGYYD